MVMCFAANCNQYSERGTCKFYKFPKDPNLKNTWINLVRRVDKEPTKYSVLCSCHFKDGLRVNGPTMFEHNVRRQLIYHSPSPKKNKSKAKITEINMAEDNEDPIPLDSSPMQKDKNQEIHLSSMRTSTPLPSFNYLEDVQPSSNISAFLETSDCLMEKEVSDLSNPQPSTSKQLSLSSSSSAVLEASNYFLEKEVSDLSAKLEKLETTFSFSSIEHSEKLIVLYTGLPNKDIFLALFDLLSKVEVNYYLGWKVEKISPLDQLFMTLYKLRLNTPYDEIAYRFNCSRTMVSNVFVTYLHLLHEIVFETLMDKMPSRVNNMACLPNCFSLFPNTRVVLDCTKVSVEIPHSLEKQRNTHSYYKHKNTLKGLIGVAPNGVVTYVSKLYPGSISDKKIVENCGVLKLFETGDLIIADKGFLITDILPPGVTLNIPPFLLEMQFTPEQVAVTRNIARARIHVERAIRRMKAFRILTIIPQNLTPMSSKIFQVCAALSNFQYPLIKEVEMYYKESSSQ